MWAQTWQQFLCEPYCGKVQILLKITITMIYLLKYWIILTALSIFCLIFTFYCIKIHSVLKKQYLPLPCWINQEAPPTSNFQPIRLLDPGCWYKFTNKMTNSADPDQLASSEANWSRSTLLDVHCLQRQGISRFSKTRVNNFYLSVWSDMLHRYGVTLISKITWWIIHCDDAKHHIQLYYPKMCMKSLSLEISWFCDFFWRQVFDVRLWQFFCLLLCLFYVKYLSYKGNTEW